jgi:ABC-2 type transport system permease protein
MVSAAFLIMLVSFIIGWVCAAIVTGAAGGFTGDFILLLLKTAGIELLLITAFAALLVMVAMAVRNLGGVIAIDVIGIMSLEMPLFLALQYLFNNKVEFSEFSLMYNIVFYQMNTGVTGSDYLRSVIVGAAFLALTTALGIFLFKKSDVK